MQTTIRRVLFCVLIMAAAFTVTASFSATGAQQPNREAPPPATQEQCQGENRAYRDRIASLERQLDAEAETAKTFMLRAAVATDAMIAAGRLADHYRLMVANREADLEDLRAELRELRRRPRREKR